MGESAYLRRSLSQPSGSFRETREGDPLNALRESVSFGRFMSEPLAWEKWSVFSRNRYMEEAEKFSKPGSVAQKKAYFEAQFKKKAAERAVTLLEDSNVAAAVATTDVAEPPVTEDNNCNHSSMDSGLAKEESYADEQEQLGKEVANSIIVCSGNDNSSFETDESDASKLEKEEVSIQVSIDGETSKPPDNSEDQNKFGFAIEKRMLSSEKASALEITASKIHKGKANVLSKTSSSEVLLSSAKRAARVQTRNENNLAPASKSFVKDLVDKKRANSLHMSIHFSSGAAEISKKISPIVQKSINFKNVTTSLNVSKNYSASSQAKTKAFVNGSLKRPSLNMKSEDKRSYSNKAMPSKSVAGGIASDRKLKSPLPDNSESSNGKGRKPRSSIVSSPFSFRSEERAEKRKQFYQRLEEKRNVKEAQKNYPQTRHQTALMQPKSPAFGRKPAPNKIPDANDRPSENTKSKALENDQSTNWSVTSRSQKNARENSSPNIQNSALKIS